VNLSDITFTTIKEQEFVSNNINIQSNLSYVTLQGNSEIGSHRSLNTGLIDMKCTERKYKLWSHNTSYCLIEVVTKSGLTVLSFKYIVQKYYMYR
jgi:hypothetical protein